MFVSCISNNCFFFRKHFPEMYFHDFFLAQGKTLWFFMQWYALEKHFSVFEMYFYRCTYLFCLGKNLVFVLYFHLLVCLGEDKKKQT